MSLDPDLLQILACPACHRPVTDEGTLVRCEACGRTYPVREVPIMLLEESSSGD